MALGTVTFTKKDEVLGDKRLRYGTINPTAGANYTTGGELLPASVFNLAVLEHLVVDGVSRAGNRLVTWDDVNGKLQVWTALGTEAAAASDQSAQVVHFVAIGY